MSANDSIDVGNDRQTGKQAGNDAVSLAAVAVRPSGLQVSKSQLHTSSYCKKILFYRKLVENTILHHILVDKINKLYFESKDEI